MTLTFPAVRLADDRLLFSDADKARIRSFVSTLKVPYFCVEFRPPHRPRNRSQSGLFHAICQEIAVQNHDEFDRVKMELKQLAISRGWPYHYVAYQNADGVMIEMSIAKSESLATVEQESILIDVARQVAAERGVFLEVLK